MSFISDIESLYKLTTWAYCLPPITWKIIVKVFPAAIQIEEVAIVNFDSVRSSIITISARSFILQCYALQIIAILKSSKLIPIPSNTFGVSNQNPLLK
jgi:hypothetical protein